METLIINRNRTVLLVMDFLSAIVKGFGGPDVNSVLQNATTTLNAARQAGLMVVHVLPGGMASREELVPSIHPAVAPMPEEQIICKSRIGAFSTTGLDCLLRHNGKDTLVMIGIATSGVVTSTARYGFDVGYKQIIIEDACGDPEPAAHRALTSLQTYPASYLGLWRLARIITTEQFTKALN